MHETCKLPTASLRAPNLHPSSGPNRGEPQETMPNSRSAKSDTTQQDAAGCNENSCAHAREATAFRFLSLGTNCGQVAADLTYRLELPSPSRHANRSDRTSGAKPLTEFLVMY